MTFLPPAVAATSFRCSSKGATVNPSTNCWALTRASAEWTSYSSRFERSLLRTSAHGSIFCVGTTGVGRRFSPRRSSYFSMGRSEEHTSELQSRLHLVCRLLLEKKKPARRVGKANEGFAVSEQIGERQAICESQLSGS